MLPRRGLPEHEADADRGDGKGDHRRADEEGDPPQVLHDVAVLDLCRAEERGRGLPAGRQRRRPPEARPDRLALRRGLGRTRRDRDRPCREATLTRATCPPAHRRHQHILSGVDERVGRAFAILNPAAGGGRTSRVKDELVRLFREAGRHVEIVQTSEPGDGARLAREAVDDGYVRIIAVGGDGTVHEAVNGMIGTEAALERLEIECVPGAITVVVP